MSNVALLTEVSRKTSWFAGYLSELYRLKAVAKKLDVPEGVDAYLDVNQPDGPSPSEIVFWVSGEQMAETARALLPAVGKFAKKFDETTGQLSLLADLDGIRISLEGAPPSTCTVEKVVEEIEVPAKEAHTEKTTRYVMVGDCDPLLKPPEPEPVTVPEDDQSPTEEDTQHA
jgi:hypothetical protein